MEMKHALYTILKWFLKYGIWILLGLSVYMVLAAEFRRLCFVKLPLSEMTVCKLNDIGKSIALSYIAGVIFYVFSEKIPFVRKKRYLNARLKIQIERLHTALTSFLESICGNGNIKDANSAFWDTTGKEYEGKGYCEINKSQLFSIRTLLAVYDDALDDLISCDVYLDEKDYQTVVEIKTDNTLAVMRKLSQMQDQSQIEQTTMFEILSGAIAMFGKLGKIEFIKE